MAAIRTGWAVTAVGRTEIFTCDAARPTAPVRLDPTQSGLMNQGKADIQRKSEALCRFQWKLTSQQT